MQNTNEQIDLIIPLDMAGVRIDKAIALLLPQYTRTVIQQWIQNGAVTINGKVILQKTKVQGGENAHIKMPLLPQLSYIPQPIALNIIHQDSDIIVINKPAGMVVHPGAGKPDQTILNGLLFHFPDSADIPRAGIVHRLDKDTTGLMIIARNLSSYHHLTKKFSKRKVKKSYYALVYGKMISGGTISQPIGRHPSQRTKMAVTHKGKEAVTHYRIKKRYMAQTLLDIQIDTGRTHQIRVHLSSIGHHIVGDSTYGKPNSIRDKNNYGNDVCRSFPRQALHAYKLSIEHPTSQKEITFTQKLPLDMESLINNLQKVISPKA